MKVAGTKLLQEEIKKGEEKELKEGRVKIRSYRMNKETKGKHGSNKIRTRQTVCI
jgi:hypothetical protein